QRGKGVPRVAGEPSGAAQAHRVSAGPEVLPAVVPVPDAPGGDDRQGDPRVPQLLDHAQPDRLDRPAGQAAEAVLQQRLPGFRVQPEPFDGVDRGQGRNTVLGGQLGVRDVVVVRGQLQDHRVVAARHGLDQHRFDDLVEVEVDVVAGDVELDRRDVAGRHPLVDLVDEGDELLRREPADRDDRVLLAGARVVVAQVGVDADVAPAEGVQPAAVDLAQRLPVLLDQRGQLPQRPDVAGGEVALPGFDGDRAGGDGT